MSPREPGRRKKSSKAGRKGVDKEETCGDCEWSPCAFIPTYQGDCSRVIRESPAQ